MQYERFKQIRIIKDTINCGFGQNIENLKSRKSSLKLTTVVRPKSFTTEKVFLQNSMRKVWLLVKYGYW